MALKQAKALGISRGSVYYRPRPVSPADLAMMRRIKPNTSKPTPGYKIYPYPLRA